MNWNLDTSHSHVAFSVKHMGLATVRGKFTTFSGVAQTDDAGTPQSVEVSIETASIHTGEAQRDGHLQSADFFDAAQFPAITFKSTQIEALGGGDYKVYGDLTIKGITKAVVLDAEISKPVKDPWGLTRAGGTLTGSINRKDWDLTWNQVLEFGALLVGEQVKLSIDIEAVVQG